MSHNTTNPIMDLHEWSTNFPDAAPFAKFLDLIGYAGYPLIDWTNPSESLGFVELDLIAQALTYYANDPKGALLKVDAILIGETCGRCGDNLTDLEDGGHNLNEVAGENITDGTEWRCCDCYFALTEEDCTAEEE